MCGLHNEAYTYAVLQVLIGRKIQSENSVFESEGAGCLCAFLSVKGGGGAGESEYQ